MIAEATKRPPVAEEVQAMRQMMTADEARAAAGKIRLSVGDLRRLLLEFEDRRGYRALGYQNMRLCAEHEFGWPKSQFYRQLKAIDVERSVGVAIGDMPESHARELGRLPAGDRKEAYTAAGDGATAAQVRAEVERRLPREQVIPETEPPDYQDEEEPAPDRRAMPRSEPPPVDFPLERLPDDPVEVERLKAETRRIVEEAWAASEEVPGAVTETVGSRPAPESPAMAFSRDSGAPSPNPHPSDGAKHETAEPSRSSVGIDDDEEWTVGLLERRWLLDNGLPLPALIRMARLVVELAGGSDINARAKCARGLLREARNE